jgi:hypothetical protein
MDPATDRIVTSGEKPGVVGVETFHTDARTADATGWYRAGPVFGEFRIALGSVAIVGNGNDIEPEFVLDPVHSTTGLKPADCHHGVGADEPVASGHWSTIVEQRGVSNHDRPAVGVANDDLERALRASPEERGYCSDIVIHCEVGLVVRLHVGAGRGCCR